MKIKNPEHQAQTINKLVANQYQERFLRNFLFLLIGATAIQTGYFIYTGSLMPAGFNFLILTGLWLNLLLLRRQLYELASSMAILLILCLLLFSILTYGLSNATIFWFFVFPVVAAFLKGKHGGSLWLLLVVMVIVVLFIANELGFITTIAFTYDADTFRQLIVGIFVVAIFVYFYQDNLDQKEASLLQREATLSEIYTNLQDEIKSRQALAESLDRNLRVMEQKRARDEALLQSIGEGVVAVDKSGYVILVNSIVERLFGYTEFDVTGQAYASKFTLYTESGKSVKASQHPMQKALSSGKKQHSSQYFYRNAASKLIPVNITASPVSLGGQQYGAIEVFRDISEEKATERAKDEFVSLASHQLRTPLGAIRWYSERLLKTVRISKKGRQYIQTIYQDSARMASMISDYLNVSRLELKTQKPNISNCQIGQMLVSVIKDLQPQIQAKKLNIVDNFKPDFVIASDEKLLEMITQNLISNAVKYTPENGEITITLDSYKGENKRFKSAVAFSVQDTGIGIPEEEQTIVFSKLFRAKNALNSNVEGTGLGLYTVSAALELLGGEIGFESELGNGTKFIAIIPAPSNDIMTSNKEKT